MRRTIKFPLIMKDEVEVRSIEELRENFDLEKTINYYLDGKLQRWLKDRNYEKELNKINELNIDADNFNEGLCVSLCVVYDESNNVDVKDMKEFNHKTLKLQNFLEEDKINDIINIVAFSQEDLNKLLDNRCETIYLYDGEYSISCDNKNIRYIGIGNVLVSINETGKIHLNKENIVFENLEVKNKEVIIMSNNYKLNSSLISEIETKVKNTGNIFYFETSNILNTIKSTMQVLSDIYNIDISSNEIKHTRIHFIMQGKKSVNNEIYEELHRIFVESKGVPFKDLSE